MRCKVGIPKDEMSVEELERYKKAEEIYNYRRKTEGLSMQFTVKEIFKFIEEWDFIRMKIKKACGW